MYDLLHLLYTSKVSQHVTDGYNIAIVDKALCDRFGGLHGTSTDRLGSLSTMQSELV
jgi:hypothetical protein